MKKSFWDPASRTINPETFKAENNTLAQQYQTHLKNPTYPRTHRRNLILLGVLGASIIGAGFYFFPHIIFGGGDSDLGILGILVLPFVPAYLYHRKIKALQKDLIKMIMAQKNKWVYFPNESTEHWQIMAQKFPNIFQKGDEDQHLHDEFWGQFKAGNQSIDFYQGIFQFTIVTHGSKGRKHRTIKTKTIFSLKLNKTLKTTFSLEPEGLGSKLRSWFTRKEIDTESTEFNKTFAVYYNGQKADKQLDIIKALSPSVQSRLLQLKEQEGKYGVYFQENAVFFVFDGPLFHTMHTNFFRTVEINPEDQKYLKAKLKTILAITGNMVPFLD